MIEAHIAKRYPARADSAAFSLDVQFEIPQGITALFGPSGAGKTLTLDSIAGFTRPERGRILLDGNILFDAAAAVHLPPRARHCGYVFQNYALFPHMTLRRNLAFALSHRPRLERSRAVDAMLEQFHLSDVSGRRPHQLSGGQRQRCSIARALIGKPRALLLDEPARGLDAPLRAEFFDMLRQIRADFPIPMVLVTHELTQCLELGDRMLVISEGRIVQQGRPRDIFEKPANTSVARLLNLGNLMQAEICGLDPTRNTSRLRVGEWEIAGLYYPGHLLGDRVWMWVNPLEVRAWPRDGQRAGANQIAATLRQTVEQPSHMRLEFQEGWSAELALSEFGRAGSATEWLLEVAPAAVRVI